MVTFISTLLLPGVGLAGVNKQLDFAGSPEQVKVTGISSDETGVMVKV
jgi:hypothetical protein